MAREFSSPDIQSNNLPERLRNMYKVQDDTLRSELSVLPGMIDIVQRVCALTSTETPEVIDSTFTQVHALCNKMTETVKQVCRTFEETDPDIKALESHTHKHVAQIPEVIHSQLRSIGRFLASDVIQNAMLGLTEIRHDVTQYAPISEAAATLYDQLAELGLIIDGYILEYPQSTI